MSKFRKLRTGLHLVIVILLTLLGRHFYDGWQKTQVAKEIVTLCELPPIPYELEVLHASIIEKNVSLTVSGPDKIFDTWLGEIDKWRDNRPFQVLNFTIRESESTIRMDFSAELRK
ncbi:MAG: hypothetical protein QNL24_03035 [Akkermansiaceae bacterium]|jgi:hypothetical protein|tara:strand:+ start:10883 stop:11230 length:348 start_codon:yes stop_codon:yes gene_type:complete